jgi:hypothetical protein
MILYKLLITFLLCIPFVSTTNKISSDQIMEDEMDKPCGTYGTEERHTLGFGGET